MRKIITLLILAIAFSAMFFTCPSEAEHIEALRIALHNRSGPVGRFCLKVNESILGKEVLFKDMLEVSYRNLYFLSLTVQEQDGKNRIVAVGVLGKVFVF